ncbi:MAG TPA: hypothetical protein VMW17_24225 [Candidatus Binatia bacterium]|nr:hypothetical protein [Candidatus Binatia bacterium]
MTKTARAMETPRVDAVDGELAELGEECARVLLLLQRLAKARALRHDASEVLGELSAIILHLHVHTKGLDEFIDGLQSE